MDSVEEFEDDGFIEKDNIISNDAGEDNADTSVMHHMALNNRRAEDRAVEEISRAARAIEARHQNYVSTGDEVDEDALAGSTLGQIARQPSIKDPKLWVVKCKHGMERQIATCLMQKHLSKLPEGLNIYSVVTLDHLKGYIYVEADKDAPVKEAIDFIDGIFPSKVVLVKLNEMVSVLSVPKKKVNLRKGSWVRIKRGTYHGDLAQVHEYDDISQTVWVKLIPRLDLVAWMERDRDEDDEGL